VKLSLRRKKNRLKLPITLADRGRRESPELIRRHKGTASGEGGQIGMAIVEVEREREVLLSMTHRPSPLEKKWRGKTAYSNGKKSGRRPERHPFPRPYRPERET